MSDVSGNILRNVLGKKVDKKKSYGRKGYDREEDDEDD